MQGRKPTFGTVIPMVPETDAQAVKRAADRETQIQKTARKLAAALCPKGLRKDDPRVWELWMFWGTKLAHPKLNERLKPHTTIPLLELCRVMKRIEGIDAKIKEAAEAAKTDEISVLFYRPGEGRHGDLIKRHPLDILREAAVDRLVYWLGELGMTPRSDMMLQRIASGKDDGQGKLDLEPAGKKLRDEIQKVSKYVR